MPAPTTQHLAQMVQQPQTFSKSLSGALPGPTGTLTTAAAHFLSLAGATGAVSGTVSAVKVVLLSLSGAVGAVSGALTKTVNKMPFTGATGAVSGTSTPLFSNNHKTITTAIAVLKKTRKVFGIVRNPRSG